MFVLRAPHWALRMEASALGRRCVGAFERNGAVTRASGVIAGLGGSLAITLDARVTPRVDRMVSLFHVGGVKSRL